MSVTKSTVQGKSTAALATGSILERTIDGGIAIGDGVSLDSFITDGAGNRVQVGQLSWEYSAVSPAGGEESLFRIKTLDRGDDNLASRLTINKDGLITAPSGLTVTTGGLTVTAGGLTVTAGDLDISAGTVNPRGDTAASDAAALGYTATEGLILTGQGSSNDVTIKNDADGTVLSIPTGTTTAVFSGGVTFGSENLTANTDEGAGSTIDEDYRACHVTGVTTDANDFIVLPAISSVPRGHEIIISCNAASNFELRTPSSSNTKINNVDADGTNEYLCTDGDVIRVIKQATDNWVATSYTNLGAVRTAVVPD